MVSVSGIFYLSMLVIMITGFFLPSPWWLFSVGAIILMITAWFVGFTWRIATAADNFIEKYQDHNVQDDDSTHDNCDKWNGKKL